MVKCALTLVKELKSWHITPDLCLEKGISYRSGLRCRKDLERYESSSYNEQNPKIHYKMNCRLQNGSNPESTFSLRLHCLTEDSHDNTPISNLILTAKKHKVNGHSQMNNIVEKIDTYTMQDRQMEGNLSSSSQIKWEIEDISFKADHHEKTIVPKTTATGRFYCDFCNYSTLCKSSMKKHLKYKHASGNPRCKLYCPLCTFVTLSRTNLNEHMLTIHMNKDGKFGCTLCRYTSVYKYNLYRHLLRHKDFEYCPHCDYSTELKNCLLDHIAENHKEVVVDSK